MEKYMDEKKVLFLDIDGVIQPYNANQRFNVNRVNLVNQLSRYFNIDYHKYDEYDVSAVYYDWNLESIEIIRNILIQTKAYIVISSSWRNPNMPNKMRDLLRIHNLDKFYLGDTPCVTDIPNYQTLIKNYHYKVIEILTYLKQHNDIINYAVLDDLDLSNDFDGHFIQAHNLITKEQGEECIKILKK